MFNIIYDHVKFRHCIYIISTPSETGQKLKTACIGSMEWQQRHELLFLAVICEGERVFLRVLQDYGRDSSEWLN